MKLSRVLKKYPQLNAEDLKRRMADRFLVEETSKKIRQITIRGAKEPCYVCGKYIEISHLHHIVPVEELTVIVVYFGLYDENLYIPTVWLCPNHHAIHHYMMDKNNSVADLTLEEMDRYAEIGKMFNADRYGGMLSGEKRRALASIGSRNKNSQLVLPIFDGTQAPVNGWASSIERKAILRKQRIRQEWRDNCDMLMEVLNRFNEKLPLSEDAQRAFTKVEWTMYYKILDWMRRLQSILEQMEAGSNYEPAVKELYEILAKWPEEEKRLLEMERTAKASM